METPLLPASTVTTVVDGFTDIVSANIAVVLGVLAFSWGVYFITARLNKAKSGRL